MGKLTVGQESSAPQTPSAGLRTLFPKSDGWYEINDQGLEKKVFSENVYGRDYIGESLTGADTNTTSSFKTYLGLAYPAGIAIAGYKYEIHFCALTRYSSTSRNHIVRIALDGSTLEEEITREPKDTGNDVRDPVGYTYVINGSALDNTGGFIDFDYRAQQNGDTARVYSCTLTFKRTT